MLAIRVVEVVFVGLLLLMLGVYPAVYFPC